MALFTVTVTGSVAREVYVGLDACDDYLLDASGSGAAAYRALITADDTDGRRRLLISATRYVDQHRWQGTANGYDSTTLAFPRDDLPGEPTNEEQLALVNDAVCEMVAVLAANQNAAADADQGSNVKALGAGKARLEFFAPTKPGKGATKLPTAVDRLIGAWLAASGTAAIVVGMPSSAGTDGCSSFDDDDDYERGDP